MKLKVIEGSPEESQKAIAKVDGRTRKILNVTTSDHLYIHGVANHVKVAVRRIAIELINQGLVVLTKNVMQQVGVKSGDFVTLSKQILTTPSKTRKGSKTQTTRMIDEFDGAFGTPSSSGQPVSIPDGLAYRDLMEAVRYGKEAIPGKAIDVERVRREGCVLAIRGSMNHIDEVLQYCYAKETHKADTNIIDSTDLSLYHAIIIGCPGTSYDSHIKKIRAYVEKGGFLFTTDWCLSPMLEKTFPGYIRYNQKPTGDVVVPIRILQENHPFIYGAITQVKDVKWWLGGSSYPIQILRSDVQVLVDSPDIKNKWGEGAVLVTFRDGLGTVAHMISHTHLQKVSGSDAYVSAFILTNFIDEAVKSKCI